MHQQRSAKGENNLVALDQVAPTLADGVQGQALERTVRHPDDALGQALDVQRRVLGPDHPNTAASVYNLAIVKVHERDPAEALRLLHEALAHGLSPGECLALEKDPDLSALHGDPRFDAVVADARNRARALP